MSSEDDFDAFNELVRNNKNKLKDKYIDKCELDVQDKALESFIVSSENENDKETIDREPNNKQILNASDKKTLNYSSDIFSDDNVEDFSDTNSTSSNSDKDLTRNSFPSKTDSNSFKTPISCKPNLNNILSVFKTPKIPTFKTEKSSDKLKNTNNFPENTEKSFYKDDLFNEKKVEKTEEIVTPKKKKINLQNLIKTCDPKNKPLQKKFKRLIVESDDEEETDEKECSSNNSSEDELNDFINDSDISEDETGSENELSDLVFSGDSLDSDVDEERKKFITPKQKQPIKQSSYTMPIKRAVEKLDFISSLLNDIDDCKRDPEAILCRLKFKSKKEELAQRIYKIYNEKVFMNSLPQDIEIIWNVTLRKTAGKCYCKYYKQTLVRSIHIVLSKKVITDTDRLLKTLVHEMCHGASWMISEINGHHGPIWKNWAVKAHQAFPIVPLSSRCHNYKIEYKFHYICHNCEVVVKRHSKSLDTKRKVCKKCKGNFTLYRVAPNGKNVPVMKDSQNLNKFSIFVKQNYKEYRKPGVTHAEAMKKLSELYKSLNTTPKDELSSLLESMQLTDKLEN